MGILQAGTKGQGTIDLASIGGATSAAGLSSMRKDDLASCGACEFEPRMDFSAGEREGVWRSDGKSGICCLGAGIGN